MTRAIICDRCGKIMKDSDKYYTVDLKEYSINTTETHYCSELSGELCSDCLNKFVDFMKMYI